MAEDPNIQHVTLPTGGSIPGIPGTHGAGSYIINWLERSIVPVVDAVETTVEHVVEEAIHPESTETETVNTEPVEAAEPSTSAPAE